MLELCIFTQINFTDWRILISLPDILQCETQARRCLMILVWTVTALHLHLTTHQSPQEGEHTRLLLNLVLVVKEKAVQEKSCQNSVTSVVLNTLWKMPSFAVNVEWRDFMLSLHRASISVHLKIDTTGFPKLELLHKWQSRNHKLYNYCLSVKCWEEF